MCLGGLLDLSLLRVSCLLRLFQSDTTPVPQVYSTVHIYFLSAYISFFSGLALLSSCNVVSLFPQFLNKTFDVYTRGECDSSRDGVKKTHIKTQRWKCKYEKRLSVEHKLIRLLRFSPYVWSNRLKLMEVRVHADTYYWLIKMYDDP